MTNIENSDFCREYGLDIEPRKAIKLTFENGEIIKVNDLVKDLNNLMGCNAEICYEDGIICIREIVIPRENKVS